MRVDPSRILQKAEQFIRDATRSEPDLLAVLDRVLAARQVATHLTAHRTEMEAIPIGGTRLGGWPDIPAAVEWPMWGGYDLPRMVTGVTHEVVERGFKPSRLSLIAQLNLAEVIDGAGLLPESGWLYFFYDVVQQPGGDAPRDRDAARVIYFDGDPTQLRRLVPPSDGPEFSQSKACRVDCELLATIPWWHWTLGFKLGHRSSAEDTYTKLMGDLNAKTPEHRLLGWPTEIQGDMEFVCERNAQQVVVPAKPPGLPGATSGWMLLLQLDTDELGPGWYWGGAGCIYYWIRRQDLAARRFDRTWTILQCS